MTTLLVIDDSPIDRRLAGKLLAGRSDWTVLYAADGEEGLQKVRHFHPQLVLTDMQMPDKTGLDVVTEVRKEFPQIPVILMTAQGSEELAVKALQQGAASYVPKRLLAQELTGVVTRVLAATDEDRSRVALFSRLTEQIEQFVLPNDLPLIMSLSHHLQRSLANIWECDITERVRIGTALEEALLNAYYHGNLEVSSTLKEQDHNAFHEMSEMRRKESPWRDRVIHISSRIQPTMAQFVIHDEGPGFNPAGLPDPTDPEYLERPSGRGVLLMRAFMDEVTYSKKGNEVTLTKHRYPRETPPV
ncbi:putative transcriptional regulatory protein TcrX [Planctopirus ephydatiae]|jgi:CheY-like chemotaxis protein|uniref:Putative transcriptional regulatory protein TcrX n=1 Tax=Planctopirus ephydatiae TaxID=2528019 RepID=A0A518GRF9_9PLAN|nr:response regulator [Planctopirus ephydatiae]QDV31169.1 putative transcriptional regulatory protein TcrX [Planctopirus ephydatiae]